LTSFFMESLVLALVGGALGCALGSLCHGVSASSIVSSGMGGGKSVILKMVVDWRIIATGMGVSLFMGCVGGLVPALAAMRLKGVDSRRERVAEGRHRSRGPTPAALAISEYMKAEPWGCGRLFEPRVAGAGICFFLAPTQRRPHTQPYPSGATLTRHRGGLL